MAVFFHDFIDEFFTIIASIVLLLSFSDWLLGENRRSKMRESCGIAWLYMETKSPFDMGRDIVHSYLSFTERVFSKRTLSGLRIISLTLFFLFVSFVVFITMLIVFPGNHELYRANLKFVAIDAMIIFFPHLLITILFSSLTLSATQFFLTRIRIRVKSLRALMYVILDITISTLFLVASIYMNLAALLLNATASAYGVHEGYSISWNFASYIVTLLPSFGYLILVIAFIVLKYLRWITIKPASVFLVRFHESRSGVLTNLSIGIGAAAKLVQQAVKVWG